MRKSQKDQLRLAILECISNKAFGKKTLSELTEVLAYVMVDIACSTLGLEKITPAELNKLIAKQTEQPTLSGALLTQAALMLGWEDQKYYSKKDKILD